MAPQGAMQKRGRRGSSRLCINDLIPSVPFFQVTNHPRRKSISCRTFNEGCVLCG